MDNITTGVSELAISSSTSDEYIEVYEEIVNFAKMLRGQELPMLAKAT
jgi:hypothetical protein